MDKQSQLRHALTDRDPGDESAIADQPPAIESLLDEEDLAVIAMDEAPSIRSLTPSGLELFYSWEPRRHYKIRQPDLKIKVSSGEYQSIARDWREVPSVTTVLGVLDKSGALSWWAQGQAAAGIIELFSREVLKADEYEGWCGITDAAYNAVDEQDIVKFLVEQKLSINHVKNKAADRGTNVHTVLETFCIDQSFRGNVDLYEDHERGYVSGLNSFLDDIGPLEDIEAEVMVGSLVHGFAGRFDLLVTIPNDVEIVTKCYPQRKPKREVIPAGRVLIDLKTSKDCYPTHSLQLAAYELAAIECGYGASDYRAVLHVTGDGKYELRRANASADQFISVLQAYQAMQFKGWFS